MGAKRLSVFDEKQRDYMPINFGIKGKRGQSIVTGLTKRLDSITRNASNPEGRSLLGRSS